MVYHPICLWSMLLCFKSENNKPEVIPPHLMRDDSSQYPSLPHSEHQPHSDTTTTADDMDVDQQLTSESPEEQLQQLQRNDQPKQGHTVLVSGFSEQILRFLSDSEDPMSQVSTHYLVEATHTLV